MQLALDHVNIRTARLPAMIAFYSQVLGLESGWRPPFPFPGAWLYARGPGGAEGQAVVHLVGLAEPPPEQPALRLEHFAFRSQGRLRAFLAHLAALGVEGQVRPVPGMTLTQVNLWDPDGNHLHLDFAESLPAAVQLA